MVQPETNTLISYKRYMGIATIICDVTSGLGVIIAATMRIMIRACFRYLRMKDGVSRLILVRKYISSSISKIIRETITHVHIREMYASKVICVCTIALDDTW